MRFSMRMVRLPILLRSIPKRLEENLPDFDSQAIGAKYKGVSKEPMDSSELSIWIRIQSLVKRFQEADRIVLSVPMWNFGYPYKLKQLIDLVSQRNMLFTFDGETYGRC